MKKIYLFLTFLALVTLTFADPVDEQTAMKVGKSFLTSNTASPVLKSTVSLKTACRVNGKTGLDPKSGAGITYYYVFNVDNRGFVIVAGDDAVTPVLGYSDEGSFDPSRIPENVAKWLEGYKKEIRYIIQNHIAPTSGIAESWKQLRNGEGLPLKSAAKNVGPLVATKWNQAPYYNDLCPEDMAVNDHSVTGCVATAMAQIMKFWNFPEKGSGFHSYNHDRFGTLSANFGNTTYQWSSMPNTLNSSNTAIATLMYQVGVSVDMNYGTGDQGGSTAYVISSQSPVANCSEFALKNYFGYKNTLQGVERDNYTSNQWMTLLKTEFDESRPILYAGFGGGGGHCFVADGYDNNDYIHFNWGWGGAYDGFFQMDALNPDGLGIGGGTGSYNFGQQAVIGIQPPETSQEYSLSLYALVSLSDNPISYAQPFSIITNIANLGTGNFNGDYAAAVFDENLNFIDFVDIRTGESLESGYAYTDDLVFSSEGMVSLLPGNYYAGIFYRPTGGNWEQLADADENVNMVPFRVTYSNDIELNSPVTVTPASLTQEEPVSVNLNIVNTGGSTFTGQYAVALYDLNGDNVQTIEIMDENDGLPPGYTYLDPFLTFTASSVDVNPGTYLLAVLHKTTGGTWQLTGSTDYQNPIRVIVQAAAVEPDIYENNNAPEAAYEIPVSFTGDAAHVTTPGSNCHVGNDYDYYMIDLPAGYSYNITPRLQDSYNSDDGNTYTLDALFSASPDGENWTDTYDDVPDGIIQLDDGGTVYFLVSPYFTGETGNYLLDMSITRSSVSGVHDNLLKDEIKVYPNPAHEYLTIDMQEFKGNITHIELIDAAGNRILQPGMNRQNNALILDVRNLPDGLYNLSLYTDMGIITKKIIIRD